MSSLVTSPSRFVFGSTSPVPLTPIRTPAKKACPHKPARPSRANRTPCIDRIFSSSTETDNSFVSSIPEPPAKRRRIGDLPAVPEAADEDADPVFAALAASFAAMTVSSTGK